MKALKLLDLIFRMIGAALFPVIVIGYLSESSISYHLLVFISIYMICVCVIDLKSLARKVNIATKQDKS